MEHLMPSAAGTTLAAGLAGQRIPFESVPVVDLQALLTDPEHGPTAAAIAEACRSVGFLYVRNHGVPQALIDAVFAEAHRFFAEPIDAKMAIHIARSPHHRGYFPIFEENTDPTLTADLKEGFDMALDLPATDPHVKAGVPLHGPNVWPGGLPEFRPTLDRYYGEMRRLAGRMMRAFAVALELDPDFFEAKISKPLAQLRLLHYPPQSGHVEEKTLGCGAHTDYGCLTILAQDEVGGLQLLNGAGQWIAAPPIPGTFVINIGDQMARWTNDRFAATLHRVINTSGRERYSVPFFFDPNFDALVECLPSCQTPEEPPRYPPIKAGEHLLNRFNATFAYRRAETPGPTDH
jgi:isopenicillin N synthase-like dioxygenase